MSNKKRFGGWEIIEDSRGRRMEGMKSKREKKRENKLLLV